MKKKGAQGVMIARGTGDGMYVSFPDAPLQAGKAVRNTVGGYAVGNGDVYQGV